MERQVIEILEKYGQEHILNYLKLLSPQEEKNLQEQILKIDFENLKNIYEGTKNKANIEEKRIEHIHYTDKEKLTEAEKNNLEEIGKQIISSGHYAVITMAGGQGTRLGHSGPKGTYILNTVNGPKYLFEIIVDTLKVACQKCEVTIPWYIMTSRENHEETLNFLEKHNYFEYDKNKVKLFMQGELPLVDIKGKVILDNEKKIKEAADGNGGIYEAISKNGILNEMKQNQIDWVFISNIDNILSNFVDPLLLGLTIKENQKIAAKSVAKANAQEKIGVFCKVNGKAKIIEYIDLPQELANKKNEQGELLFGEGNFGNYLLNRSVLDDLAKTKLPYHAAFKKSDYLAENGEYKNSEEPNVYKFEAFIFDAFERYDNITILRVKREDEFAPVKNKEGVDSPQTAIELYNAKVVKSRL